MCHNKREGKVQQKMRKIETQPTKGKFLGFAKELGLLATFCMVGLKLEYPEVDLLIEAALRIIQKEYKGDVPSELPQKVIRIIGEYKGQASAPKSREKLAKKNFLKNFVRPEQNEVGVDRPLLMGAIDWEQLADSLSLVYVEIETTDRMEWIVFSDEVLN